MYVCMYVVCVCERECASERTHTQNDTCLDIKAEDVDRTGPEGDMWELAAGGCYLHSWVWMRSGGSAVKVRHSAWDI